MCGRYAFYSPAEAVRQYFSVDSELDLQPRYNITPTQDVPVIRRRDGGRELVLLHWGLVPFWAKEKSIGNRMINARAETVAEKPSFRNALKSRRCLVLANGFYEWQKTSAAKRWDQLCLIIAHHQEASPTPAWSGKWRSVTLYGMSAASRFDRTLYQLPRPASHAEVFVGSHPAQGHGFKPSVACVSAFARGRGRRLLYPGERYLSGLHWRSGWRGPTGLGMRTQ